MILFFYVSFCLFYFVIIAFFLLFFVFYLLLFSFFYLFVVFPFCFHFCLFFKNFILNIFYLFFSFYFVSFFETKLNRNQVTENWHSTWNKSWWLRTDINMDQFFWLRTAKKSHISLMSHKRSWSQSYFSSINMALSLPYFHVINTKSNQHKNFLHYDKKFSTLWHLQKKLCTTLYLSSHYKVSS